MDKNNKKFIPPEPPEETEDIVPDLNSVASATECTGMGHIFPLLPEDEDIQGTDKQ